MITEERHEKILSYLEGREHATQAELLEMLNVSESTLRRDLMALEEKGLCRRVRGGVSSRRPATVSDRSQSARRSEYHAEKLNIAAQALRCIEEGDVIYLDAGTTVEALLPLLEGKAVRAVTNSLSHALVLGQSGVSTYVLGGELKSITTALIGEEVIEALEKFRFSKGFFGTNAISEQGELLTPDIREAAVKRKAISRCEKAYILADSSKFDRTAAVRFGSLDRAVLITEEGAELPAHFEGLLLKAEADPQKSGAEAKDAALDPS